MSVPEPFRPFEPPNKPDWFEPDDDLYDEDDD